jgi:hypothetical protein
MRPVNNFQSRTRPTAHRWMTESHFLKFADHPIDKDKTLRGLYAMSLDTSHNAELNEEINDEVGLNTKVEARAAGSA